MLELIKLIKLVGEGSISALAAEFCQCTSTAWSELWVHIVLMEESLVQVPALGYELLHLLCSDCMQMQKHAVKFAAQQILRLLGYPSGL